MPVCEETGMVQYNVRADEHGHIVIVRMDKRDEFIESTYGVCCICDHRLDVPPGHRENCPQHPQYRPQKEQ